MDATINLLANHLQKYTSILIRKLKCTIIHNIYNKLAFDRIQKLAWHEIDGEMTSDIFDATWMAPVRGVIIIYLRYFTAVLKCMKVSRS